MKLNKRLITWVAIAAIGTAFVGCSSSEEVDKPAVEEQVETEEETEE